MDVCALKTHMYKPNWMGNKYLLVHVVVTDCTGNINCTGAFLEIYMYL